jgi:betaine-aldehyde dehydrogenase
LYEVRDPATEDVIGRVPAATPTDADAAVERAAAAFDGWRAVTPADRVRLLRRLAERLDAERERLGPAGDAQHRQADRRRARRAGMVVDTFAYYAGAPERLLGDTIPVAGGVNLTFREPLGVVGLVMPWNFPLTIASWKLAPALAAGNTVVLKPAGLMPLTALAFAELAEEAGIPPGVVIDDRVRRWVAETSAAQGLPPTVEDDEYLRMLATDVLEIISSNRERAAGRGRTRASHGQSAGPSRYETAA